MFSGLMWSGLRVITQPLLKLVGERFARPLDMPAHQQLCEFTIVVGQGIDNTAMLEQCTLLDGVPVDWPGSGTCAPDGKGRRATFASVSCYFAH